MKGILVFGALAALIGIAAWLLYPKTKRSPSPEYLPSDRLEPEHKGEANPLNY